MEDGDGLFVRSSSRIFESVCGVKRDMSEENAGDCPVYTRTRDGDSIRQAQRWMGWR